MPTMKGSLINRLSERQNFPKPTVGMGATMLCWTDRHACTICDVESDARIWIQEDRANVVKGSCQDGSAVYEYERQPNAPKKLVTLRKDGRWHEGTTMKGTAFAIGYREEYYDPCF